MKNRNVGFLIVGLSVIIAIIVMIFNFGLRDIVSQTCDHGPTCTMYDSISMQTYFSLGISGIVLLIGLFFVFTKESEKVIFRKIREPKKKIDLSGLDENEKEVMRILQAEGAVFQASLMEKLEIGKVGMTRLLDKLEAKQLIERKRRGMNNVVILKSG